MKVYCANTMLRLQNGTRRRPMRFEEWSATEEEPVTADLLALMCREDSERVTRIIQQAGTARGRFLAEFRSPDLDDGGTAWCMVRGQAFQQDAEVGVIAIVWDITEFKSAELALYEK